MDAPIVLFGFQEGPRGFVRRGLGYEGEGEAEDFLFLRACAGRGGGKSYAGAMRSVLYMNMYPKSRGMITAPTDDTLRDSTLPPLFEILERCGLKQGQSWDYHNTYRVLTLYNGSIAYCRTTERPANLPGPTLGWFWMDEYQLSPEEAWAKLIPTLRQEGYPHQAWLTGTPGGKQHWSRKVFLPKRYAQEFDVPVYERTLGTYVTYHAHTKDNPHGGLELDALMKSTHGDGSPLYRQQALGEEIMVENLRFDIWDRGKFIVPQEQWPQQYPDRVLAGVDFGFTHPSAILVMGIDEKGRQYVIDAFRKSRMSEGELVEQAGVMREQHGIRYFFADSADPRWIRAMRQAGLPVFKARKSLGAVSDPSSGFGLCYAALTRTVDDSPAFFVHPRCKLFVQEIEHFADETIKNHPYAAEMPKRQRDDLIACWRYGEMGIQRLWGRPPVSSKTMEYSYAA